MIPKANIWTRLGAGAKVGLVFGCVAIVGAMVAVAFWAYRPDYQLLFSDVTPRDAAAMTAALEKMKTPYQLGDDGTSILVPKDLVYKTRLKLMGSDVPLHGAVGFEVFNNADFGMTEFVQKVNYLRAIQGELTRTIMAIEGIQSARVHLALPEQGLFKKSATKPKASVTLVTKPGQELAPAQITGIQRLVAASVPDILSADVTVLDQHGVALTRSAGGDGDELQLSQLDSKRSTEDYLVKKVGQVLDRTFGPGAAIATVDVALNLDHGKVTTEEVVPAKGGFGGASPTGVVVRERQSARDGDAGGAPGKPAVPGVTSKEADYQVGRRVEHMSITGGTVRRMTVAVVVRQPLSASQLERLKEVVALAVGLNAARGDAIVVQSMDSLVAAAVSDPVPGAVPATAGTAPPQARPASGPMPDPASATLVMWVLLAMLAFSLAAGLWILRARRRPVPAKLLLGDKEREQMLADVRAWVQAPPAGAKP